MDDVGQKVDRQRTYGRRYRYLILSLKPICENCDKESLLRYSFYIAYGQRKSFSELVKLIDSTIKRLSNFINESPNSRILYNFQSVSDESDASLYIIGQ